jgi:isoquinoline 1-oxidoreductase beta subunit
VAEPSAWQHAASQRRALEAGVRDRLGAGGGLLLGYAALRKGRPVRAAEGSFAPNDSSVSTDGVSRTPCTRWRWARDVHVHAHAPGRKSFEVDLAQVRPEPAPADNDLYAEPPIGEQMTGGSTSVRVTGSRQARGCGGAHLCQSCGAELGVAPESCRARTAP